MDLKVVGAGKLGCRVAFLWKQKFPQAKIYLKTRSFDEERSARWKSFGFHPISSEDDGNHVKAPFVVFCAPPTNNPHYADDVKKSVHDDWICEGDGVFIFTGSGSVYSENSGQVVDENSSVTRETERATTLLTAEDAVLLKGGLVLRFGGLYSKASQLGNYWLGTEEKKEINARPNGLINLIHYDDAARCVFNALSTPLTGEKHLFLVSDGVPISRLSICEAALKFPPYCNRMVPSFSGDPAVIDGKKYQTLLVRNTFKWTPKFQSFAEFMESSYDQELDVHSLIL